MSDLLSEIRLFIASRLVCWAVRIGGEALSTEALQSFYALGTQPFGKDDRHPTPQAQE